MVMVELRVEYSILIGQAQSNGLGFIHYFFIEISPPTSLTRHVAYDAEIISIFGFVYRYDGLSVK